MRRDNDALPMRRGTKKKRAEGSLTIVQKVGLILGVIAFAVPFFVDIPNLEGPGQRMLSILLLAVVFWITEAIPLVATAVLIIFLEVILISAGAILDPTGGDEALAETVLPAADYFAALANPVIILFLGGFMIALGAEKYRLDRNIAALVLKPFSGSARITILGLMLITAVLSMFMSNTATTATMFAVCIPIIKALDDPKEKAGLALAIPLAANLGGIGTPVGTPPNAIAVAGLAEAGYPVSFVQWMYMAVPFMLILLGIGWLLLALFFVPRSARIEIDMEQKWDTSANAILFYIVTGITLILWMSEPLHGVSSNIVGFLPVAALLGLRVMSGDDVKQLDWPVLWLVSGGIALGTGVDATELDAWLVDSISWETLGAVGILGVIGIIGLSFGNVISNSAAANLLVPIAVSLAVSLDSIDVITMAAIVALACSLGIALPISTPPNAIAYSTGTVSVKQMAFIGVSIGIIGTVLLVFAIPTLWGFMGVG